MAVEDFIECRRKRAEAEEAAHREQEGSVKSSNQPELLEEPFDIEKP